MARRREVNAEATIVEEVLFLYTSSILVLKKDRG